MSQSLVFTKVGDSDPEWSRWPLDPTLTLVSPKDYVHPYSMEPCLADMGLDSLSDGCTSLECTTRVLLRETPDWIKSKKSIQGGSSLTDQFPPFTFPGSNLNPNGIQFVHPVDVSTAVESMDHHWDSPFGAWVRHPAHVRMVILCLRTSVIGILEDLGYFKELNYEFPRGWIYQAARVIRFIVTRYSSSMLSSHIASLIAACIPGTPNPEEHSGSHSHCKCAPCEPLTSERTFSSAKRLKSSSDSLKSAASYTCTRATACYATPLAELIRLLADEGHLIDGHGVRPLYPLHPSIQHTSSLLSSICAHFLVAEPCLRARHMFLDQLMLHRSFARSNALICSISHYAPGLISLDWKKERLRIWAGTHPQDTPDSLSHSLHLGGGSRTPFHLGHRDVSVINDASSRPYTPNSMLRSTESDVDSVLEAVEIDRPTASSELQHALPIAKCVSNGSAVSHLTVQAVTPRLGDKRRCSMVYEE
jgi:hypothetical protein